MQLQKVPSGPRQGAGDSQAVAEAEKRQDLRRKIDYSWLATALHSAGDAIVIVDDDGKVQFLNKVAEHLTRWSRQEAQGQHFSSILRFEHAGSPMTDDIMRLATLNEEPLSLGSELALISQDGHWQEVEAEISRAPPADGQPGNAVFTLRDVTQRKWEEYQHRQEHAIRAVEGLAEATKHSLNNLLTSLLGNSELLLNTPDLPVEQRDAVLAIQTGTTNIAEVVRQLSAISRTKFVTRREIDLNDLIRTFLKSEQNSFSCKANIRVELEPELHRISADKQQVEQLLFALVSNAHDAVSAGSEIVISTRNTIIESAELSKVPQTFATVTVRDIGLGISREIRERIFEPFFTTKNGGGHTGLGLCIAQGMVRDYGGFLDVNSEVASGTSVVFGIPAIEPDTFSYLDKKADTESTLKTVLIVEDDHAVRQLLRRIIEKRGYAAVEAQDAEDAMMIAELHEGRIDLLLTDIAMPGISGPDLVRQFAGLHPEAKVLLISGHSPDRIGPIVNLPRGTDFLQKPFTQKTLLMRIEDLLSDSGK